MAAKSTSTFAAVLLTVLAARTGFALEPGLPVSQYLHTSWTQEEGDALPPISTLAQTADGYLWMGTAGGLLRFDGMRFVPWEPRAEDHLSDPDVRTVLSSAAGGVWIRTL